jgi:hypothetical protein
MATHKYRSLPNDVARCSGTNCRQRQRCQRYRQIELDRKYGSRDNRYVYTDSPRSGDECKIQIGVEE